MNLSRLFHCSVIKVLFYCSVPTALIFYHTVSCLSRTFLFFCGFCFRILWNFLGNTFCLSSWPEPPFRHFLFVAFCDSQIILACLMLFVNNYFYFFYRPVKIRFHMLIFRLRSIPGKFIYCPDPASERVRKCSLYDVPWKAWYIVPFRVCFTIFTLKDIIYPDGHVMENSSQI